MSEVGEQVRDGRLVGGRYRLLERIGSGGMGTVWRAFDELVDREVAVKQPRLPGDPEDEEFQRAAHRLYREARAAARVDHPSAVAIHDVVIEDDQLPWIVMELVRGESLHELLRRGRLAPAESARIGRAVLGALSAAHAVGIVHRDVKPANVLLGPHDRVVLTDFGIAHIQGEESLTASGEFVGSLEFIAPERMSGTGAGPASDLWSLGVLLYAAVEGASPFRRTTVESTLGAILSGEPPEPTRAGPLGPLIVRMLARDPAERPGAEEVGAVLEAVAAGKDVPEPALAAEPEEAATVAAVPEPEPEPRTEPGPKSRPRRTLLITLGALLPAGLVLGTVLERVLGKDSDSWTAHQRGGMNAVLFLPPQYRLLETQAAAGSRTVTYGTGALRVRLTEWDVAADTALAEAHALGQGTANPQYTRTSFRGNKDAILADTTYRQSGVPTRAMALIIRTADNRMYELRVDMPKGTPAEKKGTALFKGARARLTLPEK
ncbi:serine/threonine-protein kinase [Streptomyces sp. L7]